MRDMPARVALPGPTTLLLSISQAAKLLGVGRDQVRCWIDTGELQTLIPPGGHQRRIKAASVLRLAGVEVIAPPMGEIQQTGRD